jgi:hypothetical protein
LFIAAVSISTGESLGREMEEKPADVNAGLRMIFNE